MRKYILLFIVFFLVNAKADPLKNISVAPHLGIFLDSPGAGATVGMGFQITERIEVGGQTGFSYFWNSQSKSSISASATSNALLIPLLATVNYGFFIDRKVRLNVGFAAGVSYLSDSSSLEVSGSPTFEASDSSFLLTGLFQTRMIFRRDKNSMWFLEQNFGVVSDSILFLLSGGLRFGF